MIGNPFARAEFLHNTDYLERPSRARLAPGRRAFPSLQGSSIRALVVQHQTISRAGKRTGEQTPAGGANVRRSNVESAREFRVDRRRGQWADSADPINLLVGIFAPREENL